jgi:NAD(P)-dependent dehydrogenase (short-subunit alcohol dehydrogenase family)
MKGRVRIRFLTAPATIRAGLAKPARASHLRRGRGSHRVTAAGQGRRHHGGRGRYGRRARPLVRQEGAKVIVGDVNATDGEQLAAQLGYSAVLWTSTSPIRNHGNRRLTHTFGVPTILVNNAGVTGPVALATELTDDAYHRTV